MSAREYPFDDGQKAIIVQGFEDTAATVPHREGLNYHYVILRGSEPIGSYMVFPRDNGYAEVGARFWSGKAHVVSLLTLAVSMTLQHYKGVIAVVYTDNQPVKKLLQAGGFRLLTLMREEGTGKGLEVHGVNKEHFYRIMEMRAVYRKGSGAWEQQPSPQPSAQEEASPGVP